MARNYQQNRSDVGPERHEQCFEIRYGGSIKAISLVLTMACLGG
jgi:hypothetical protein